MRPKTLTPEQRRAYARDSMRKWRAKNGWTSLNMDLDIASAACLLYLQKQWGFETRRETVGVALKYLAKQTRLGLQEIKLGFDEADD